MRCARSSSTPGGRGARLHASRLRRSSLPLYVLRVASCTRSSPPAATTRRHPGEISFPAGAQDERRDRPVRLTALREAEERSPAGSLRRSRRVCRRRRLCGEYRERGRVRVAKVKKEGGVAVLCGMGSFHAQRNTGLIATVGGDLDARLYHWRASPHFQQSITFRPPPPPTSLRT